MMELDVDRDTVPGSLTDGVGALLSVSPLREVTDVPGWDVFRSSSASPVCSAFEPVATAVMPSLHEDVDSRPLPSPATMDQYLLFTENWLLEEEGDLPLLPRQPVSRSHPWVLRLESGGSVPG